MWNVSYMKQKSRFCFLLGLCRGSSSWRTWPKKNSSGTFTVLVPISAKTLTSLEVGATSVRDALTATCGWLHLNNGYKTGTWSIDFDQFPTEYLPLPGTPLLPEHEPVLRTRAVGEKIVLGQMPASVVSFVADATKKAIKTLL